MSERQPLLEQKDIDAMSDILKRVARMRHEREQPKPSPNDELMAEAVAIMAAKRKDWLEVFNEGVEAMTRGEYPWVGPAKVIPAPTFLPLMKRPVRSVEKDNAEKEMRDLLERTRLMMRGE